ncbi:MAG: biotin--[acetyl-CoA-carboxylase] ligase, partial [Actinomycetota bacterium]
MSDLSQQALEDATHSWSPAVRYLEETDSTNRVAMEWADQGAPEGCLVVADFQTAGRGRLDREWFSPAGASLLFSLILKPGIVVEDLGILSLAGAAAVCGALGGVGADPRIKWPNDVRLNGRKVAGILAEASVEIGRAVSVVLGVGMNVSIEEDEFPPELRDIATSLLRETGSRADRIEILCGFLRS